jgi:hypothetical protein
MGKPVRRRRTAHSMTSRARHSTDCHLEAICRAVFPALSTALPQQKQMPFTTSMTVRKRSQYMMKQLGTVERLATHVAHHYSLPQSRTRTRRKHQRHQQRTACSSFIDRHPHTYTGRYTRYVQVPPHLTPRPRKDTNTAVSTPLPTRSHTLHPSTSSHHSPLPLP